MDEARPYAQTAAQRYGTRANEIFEEALSAITRRSVGKRFGCDRQRASWCRITARGAAQDVMRRLKMIGQKGQRAGIESLAAAEGMADPSPGALQILSAKEQTEALARAINSLPAGMRELRLRVHPFGTETASDIAGDEGVSVSAICHRLATINNRLRPILERELDRISTSQP